MTQPIATLSDSVTFSAVTVADFDELAALRIAAMRDSLERIGRFDPERARERLRKSFHPEHTEFVVLDGQRIGFHTFHLADDGFHLDHLYIHPSCQARGVGSHVIRLLLSQADTRQMPVRLGALRDSPSNRFYQRHGFVQTGEDEWDIYYLRTPQRKSFGQGAKSLTTMNATVVTQPKLRLITRKSAKFPEGNRDAFSAIESHLKTLKGRRFYGLVYQSDEGMDYFAGLVPDSEIEERRFSELGFAITEIEGGACARIKLLDWTSKTDQIGPSFGAMIDRFGVDISRPQMEYYRSLSELHLLLPVTAEQQKA